MSTGQALGAVAGGVAGFFIGGPAGALQGATWGAALGGVLDPPKGPTVQGPRLNDLSWQQSSYGGNIPRAYGTVALSGNVIWLENNKLKEVVKKKKSGGKGGGGGTTTETYTYFATFALMLCQGEIAGIRRMWCGDKLIYNAGSDDLETIIASNQAAKGWRLYRGTDDQLPDPRYEADVGVGNAPAFRGYSYIVFDDFALADYGNTLQAAQFKVEIVSLSSIDSLMVDYVVSDSSAGNRAPGAPIDDSGCRYELVESGSTGTYATTLYKFYGDTKVDQTLLVTNPSRVLQSLASNLRTFLYAFLNVDLTGTTTSYVCFGNGATPEVIALPPGARGICFLEGAGGEDVFIAYTSYEGQSRICRFSKSAPGMWGEVARVIDVPDCLIFDSGDYLYGISRALTSAPVLIVRYRIVDLVQVASSSHSVATVGSISNNHNNCWDYNSGILFSIGYDPTGIDFFQLDPDSMSIIDNYRVDYSLAPLTSPLNACARAFSGIIGRSNRRVSPNAQATLLMRVGRETSERIPIAEVIIQECELSSLITASDLDTTLLEDSLLGYRVSGGTIRSVIEPLQGAYPFDVVPSGYKIKFVPRGQSSAVTIPWEDLAATDGSDIGDSLPYSREMDSQLPQKVNITALSADREYGESTQYYERLNTSAVNTEDRDIPLVLSDDEIAQMAEKLLFLRWLERDDFDFSLPPTYLDLEPADVATVNAKFGTFELRLAETNYESDGRLTCKAKLNNAAIYTSNAVGAPGHGPDGTIPLTGESIVVLMDIPVVDETVQNSVGFAAAMAGYTNGWSSGVLVQSPDSGQTWSELQAFDGKGTFGRVTGVLPSSSCTVIDQRSLTVSLLAGELESVTRDQMLAGVNYAAYGVDGRWEIVRFQNAVLQPNGSYVVSGFVRGQRGTEWASGLHQQNDWFVLLDDPDNLFIGMSVESIGQGRTYRAVTAGASIDSASDQAFTYRGVNLECLSPVYAKGSRDGSSNFSGTFTRRSRLSNTWWTNGVVAPVGEASEAYEIDVMSGSTVKRTISVASPAWSYSAADQTTDFGSVQSSITFRLYQLSDKVGRGYPLEVTL